VLTAQGGNRRRLRRDLPGGGSVQDRLAAPPDPERLEAV
jgi:hypothetical protein